MKLLSFVFLIYFAFLTNSYTQEIKGTYAIKNVQTGMLLRIKDADSKSGTPLVSYSAQNWKCMTWDFQATGENTYQLKNLFTKKTFQPLGELKDAVLLEEQPIVSGAANQQYEFIRIKKDIYLIRLKGTELYLSPVDAQGSTNSAIVLSKKKDGALQQWNIYHQNPTM
jgi:hypothetical protein